jgi:predicted MFS family arabinose efflux permease
MHSLWSKWSPPFERARLATFALSGSYLGSVAALSLGGFIGSYWNWQAIFYIFGERIKLKINTTHGKLT